MIDITGVDLRKFVQEAYALSGPQGLGFLHARPGGLSDEDAQAILDRESAGSTIAASMDYVHGRACKMTVFRGTNGQPERGGAQLLIDDSWFDHSARQLDELLSRCGIKRVA